MSSYLDPPSTTIVFDVSLPFGQTVLTVQIFLPSGLLFTKESSHYSAIGVAVVGLTNNVPGRLGSSSEELCTG